MTLRKLPGAIAFGAPAALIGHMALFGEGHRVGGGLHDLVLYGTLAAAALFGLTFSLLAWRGVSAASTGSILAARLFAQLPGPAAIFCSAIAAYAGIESLEAQHNPANIVLLVCALLAATLLVYATAKFAIRGLAGIAIAIAASGSYDERPSRYLTRAPLQFFFATQIVATHRLFARPPPSFA